MEDVPPPPPEEELQPEPAVPGVVVAEEDLEGLENGGIAIKY